MADGLPNSQRIDPLTYIKIYNKVVDNVQKYPTYFSRLLNFSESFEGKTFSIPVQVSTGTGITWVGGLETLPMAATDTVISLEYNHTVSVRDVTLPYIDLWANSGKQQVISLYDQKYAEAGAVLANALGRVMYGNGGGAPAQMNGFGNIIDDGTVAATIGGQSRTIYPQLDAYVLPSGGTLTLALLQTVDDNTTVAGAEGETTKVVISSKTGWSLYEQLLNDKVRYNYDTMGGSLALPLASRNTSAMPRSQMKSAEPFFETLAFRGKPLIKDEYAYDPNSPDQPFFFVNEKYLTLYGRSDVPANTGDQLIKLSGTNDKGVYEGATATEVNARNGWFYRKDMAAITQLGMIGYFIYVGQLVTSQPRSAGKLTGVNTI